MTGACVDMINEPEEYDFKHKVRVTAYPTCELGELSYGRIWVRPKKIPAVAEVRLDPRRPKPIRHVTKVIEECNWLQALEGGIDTSHAPILHRLLTDSSKRGGIKPSNPFVRGKAPKLVVDITDYGYQYAGIRPLQTAPMTCTSASTISSCRSIRSGHQSRRADWISMPVIIWVPTDDGNLHGLQLELTVRTVR